MTDGFLQAICGPQSWSIRKQAAQVGQRHMASQSTTPRIPGVKACPEEGGPQTTEPGSNLQICFISQAGVPAAPIHTVPSQPQVSQISTFSIYILRAAIFIFLYHFTSDWTIRVDAVAGDIWIISFGKSQ